MRERAEWQALQAQREVFKNTSLIDLFLDNPNRFQDFSIESNGILLDYSKNFVTKETMDSWLHFANACQVPSAIAQLIAGEYENSTEQRKVRHTMLRNDKLDAVTTERKRMFALATQIREQKWLGVTGKVITDVVNIGIGGSCLGPKMAIQALRDKVTPNINFHFLSNLDGGSLQQCLQTLDISTTLFIVSSKSFSTAETRCLAECIKKHYSAQYDMAEVMQSHFIAATANRDNAIEFGIVPQNIYTLWDYIGGRFSLFSAVGMSLAIAIGETHFQQMLNGANAMDEHFESAPLLQNMPFILGALSVWYCNFFNAQTQAIIAYDDGLRDWVDYLQQTHMESNGKSVTNANEVVDYATCPVIWGGVGTEVQHSFMQCLHQGTHFVPVDFVLPATNQYDTQLQMQQMANCLAQANVLMQGSNQQTPNYKKMLGNRPSNILLFSELTPYILGALISLYEHKVFIQGLLWNINSFDQWGVELGKEVAKAILPSLESGVAKNVDGSTAALIAYFKNLKGDL